MIGTYSSRPFNTLTQKGTGEPTNMICWCIISIDPSRAESQRQPRSRSNSTTRTRIAEMLLFHLVYQRDWHARSAKTGNDGSDGRKNLCLLFE